jgi:hypothetical protein
VPNLPAGKQEDNWGGTVTTRPHYTTTHHTRKGTQQLIL